MTRDEYTTRAEHTPRAFQLRWALGRLVGHGPDRPRDASHGRWSSESTRVRLLWTVALELDEQLPPTETGESVCRVCSGWGEVIVELDQTIFGSPDFFRRARNRGAAERIRRSPRFRTADHPRSLETRMVVDPCACERKRPHTVQLHRIVETIAAMRSPLVDDWPEQWLVDIDRREAAGDRSPMAVWWTQFFAWTRGGAVDEQALADALEQLAALRERRRDYQRPTTPEPGILDAELQLPSNEFRRLFGDP